MPRHLLHPIVIAASIVPLLVHAQAPGYAWARFAGNVGGQQAFPAAIAVDRQGNVFSYGQGTPSITWGGITLSNSLFYLMKADATGTVQWVRNVDVALGRLAADGQGAVYLAATTELDVHLGDTVIAGSPDRTALLVKFAANGDLLWVRNHIAAQGRIVAGEILTDAFDNVYLCAQYDSTVTVGDSTFLNAGNGAAGLAIKYSPQGDVLRVNSSPGIAPAIGIGGNLGMICDTAGTICRVGQFSGSVLFGDTTMTAIGNDGYVVMFDPQGQRRWARSTGGAGIEGVGNVRLDGRGHVIVEGAYTSTLLEPDSATVLGRRLFNQSQQFEFYDAFLASFAADGDLDWIKRAGGNGTDNGPYLAVDALDNVYWAGLMVSSAPTLDTVVVHPNRGSFISKFDRDGHLKWFKHMVAGFGSNVACQDIAADRYGNTYVTGFFTDTIQLDAFQSVSLGAGNFDAFLARLGECPIAITSITADGPLAFCPEDSVVLAAANADGWLWNDGSAAQRISANTSGEHFVIIADSLGCMAWSDTVITIMFDPVVPTVTLIAGILHSMPANSYQWYLNGEPLAGASNATYDPIETGDYTVVTSDANGCRATSSPFPFITTGLAERPGAGDQALARPTIGAGHIVIDMNRTTDQLSLVNALGQNVWRADRPGGTTIAIDIPRPGIYFLCSTRESQRSVQRFVITDR